MGTQVLPFHSTETPGTPASDAQLVYADTILDPTLMAPVFDQQATSEELQLANLVLQNPGCYAHSLVCWARKIAWHS